MFCQVALRYTRKYGADKVRVLTLVQNRGKGGAVRMVRLSDFIMAECSTKLVVRNLICIDFTCILFWRELWAPEVKSFWWPMLTEPPSFLTLTKWRLDLKYSALNRCGCFSVFVVLSCIHVLIEAVSVCPSLKSLFVHLGEHGNFLWFQSSPGERVCRSGKCLSFFCLLEVQSMSVLTIKELLSCLCHSDLCFVHSLCMAFTSWCGSSAWEGSGTHSAASSFSHVRLHSRPSLLST